MVVVFGIMGRAWGLASRVWLGSCCEGGSMEGEAFEDGEGDEEEEVVVESAGTEGVEGLGLSVRLNCCGETVSVAGKISEDREEGEEWEVVVESPRMVILVEGLSRVWQQDFCETGEV